MRIHLGSDHAGFELKAHLVGWLRDQGHEPVDHGATTYDEVGRLPAVLPGGGRPRSWPTRAASGSSSAARATVSRSPPTRCRASGRRSPGRPRRPGSRACTTTPTSSPSALGCTRVEEATGFVEVFVRTPFSGDPRHVRRIAMVSRLRELPSEPCLKVTRCSGSPTSSTRRSAARPCASPARRAGSPRAPRSIDGQVMTGAQSAGKHVFLVFEGGDIVHVHLGLIGVFSLGRGAGSACGRCRPAAARGRHVVRRPARRDGLRAGREGQDGRDRGQARPGPAARRRRPGQGVPPHPSQREGRSVRC